MSGEKKLTSKASAPGLRSPTEDKAAGCDGSRALTPAEVFGVRFESREAIEQIERLIKERDEALAALREMLLVPRPEGTIERAKAVIAKAEGR